MRGRSCNIDPLRNTRAMNPHSRRCQSARPCATPCRRPSASNSTRDIVPTMLAWPPTAVVQPARLRVACCCGIPDGVQRPSFLPSDNSRDPPVARARTAAQRGPGQHLEDAASVHFGSPERAPNDRTKPLFGGRRSGPPRPLVQLTLCPMRRAGRPHKERIHGRVALPHFRDKTPGGGPRPPATLERRLRAPKIPEFRRLVAMRGHDDCINTSDATGACLVRRAHGVFVAGDGKRRSLTQGAAWTSGQPHNPPAEPPRRGRLRAMFGRHRATSAHSRPNAANLGQASGQIQGLSFQLGQILPETSIGFVTICST